MIQMNNQVLLIIQIVFVSFFIWWLLLKKRDAPKPTVLNLEKDLLIQRELTRNNFEGPIRPQEREVHNLPNVISLEQRFTKKSAKEMSSYSSEVSKYDAIVLDMEAKVTKAKALNVIFMWNGHCWDAHEVLGVTPGTSIKTVELRFKELHAQSDSGQKLFLEEAFNCIKQKS